MGKKGIILIGFLLTALIGGIYFVSPTPAHFNGYCAFCDHHVLESQKFYEDDLVVALYTHKPVMPGHSLVIPKRHVEHFDKLTDEELVHMGRVLKKVDLAMKKVFGTSASLLLQKNGVEVGQTVPHLHFHYIPRKEGDNSTIGFFIKMYIANASSPIPSQEMEEIVEKLKQAMQDMPVSL